MKQVGLKLKSEHPIPMTNSYISAGNTAIEAGDDFFLLDINKLVTGGREGFVAFEVTGDSNVPDIRPGNIIFVDTWAVPKNGDIIAATINGLTCVKEFEFTQQGLYLVSKNRKYPPRKVRPEDDFSVLGVYCGHLVVRR
jgi:SOS-response transcriptional repressor LexA